MSDVQLCSRCARELSEDRDWNVMFSKGYAIAVICHDCLEPEEYIQTEMNSATIDHSSLKVDELGRLTAIPRIKP